MSAQLDQIELVEVNYTVIEDTKYHTMWIPFANAELANMSREDCMAMIATMVLPDALEEIMSIHRNTIKVSTSSTEDKE